MLFSIYTTQQRILARRTAVTTPINAALRFLQSPRTGLMSGSRSLLIPTRVLALALLPVFSNAQSQSGTQPRLDRLSNPVATADAANYSLSASLRLGIAYQDDQFNDGDYRVQDFESRLGWSASSAVSAGLRAEGYVELGLDPDTGEEGGDAEEAPVVRQLWAGLGGTWGKLRVGRQYDSFYEMVSAATDIAQVGSCLTQFGCSRQSRVIKLQTPDAPMILSLSVIAAPDDEDNDTFDQTQFALGYKSGGLYFGLAGVNVSGEGAIESGTVIAAVMSMNFGGGSWALGYQKADEGVRLDGLASSDVAAPETTHLTLALKYGPSYLVLNRSESGDTEPSWITVGATQRLSADSELFYEYQQVDNDDGSDETTVFRAGFRYDW